MRNFFDTTDDGGAAARQAAVYVLLGVIVITIAWPHVTLLRHLFDAVAAAL